MTKVKFDLLQFFKGDRKFAFHEEIFPDEFVEDNFIIRPDGNLAASFELLFPEREIMNPSQIASIMDSIANVTEQLPTGTAVHFQSQFFNRKNNVQSILRMRLGFITSKLLDYHQDKPVLHNRVLLHIVFNFQGSKSPDFLSHFFAKLGITPNNLKKISKHKAEARSAISSMLRNFESLKAMQIKQLSSDEIILEQCRYHNLDFDAKEPLYTNDNFNKGDMVKVGNKFAGFVYLQRNGKNFYDYLPNDRNVPSFMAWPLGLSLNFPHVINLAFVIADKDKAMSELESKRNNSSSLGLLQNVNDRGMAMDIDIFLQEVRDSGRKLVYMSHNVMAWETDPEKLSNNLDHIKAAYMRMNNSVAATDAFGNGMYFHTFSPGYALDLFLTQIVKINDAVNLFEYASPHFSDRRGIMFSNREGEPVLVDLWHPDLPSYNRVVIGPSGTGKSFTMGYILGQEIEQGVEVIIIDVGGSYKNLLDAYPSKYYEYKDGERPIQFNPFLIPKDKSGRYELTKDKIVFLTSLLTILWKKINEGETLSREERTVLSKLLKLYYNHVNESKELPRLDRFIQFIKEYKAKNETQNNFEFRFFDLDSFLVVLSDFTEGTYADVLNSDETETISENNLVCFDLAGIQKDPILYPIVALLIMELVLDKVRANPTIRKEIVIDEAWSMLVGALSEFIEMLYRTVRKAGGAVTIVSQDISPIIKSPICEAVRLNAPVKILLDHSSQHGATRDLQAFFGLTDQQMDQLMSIRNQGNRREIMLVRNEIAQNYFVDAGLHVSAALSSRAEDRARVQELKEKNGSLSSAVNQIVEENLAS